MSRYRWFVLPSVGVIVIIMGFMVFQSLGDNLVYYLTPGEAVEQRAEFPDGERFRLGGQVEEGTLMETDAGVEFTVSDGAHEVHIVHTGAPPELFREGVGAIVEGAWDGDVFRSDELVVKHDEQYQAPEDEGHPYEVPTNDA